MKLSKHKISELQVISVAHDILKHYGHSFVDNSPDEWSNFEKQIYDMANEIERKMLSAILETLGGSTTKEEKTRADSVHCYRCIFGGDCVLTRGSAACIHTYAPLHQGKE